MERDIFTDEHHDFRRSVRGFLLREVVPHQEEWRDRGVVDRDVWRRAGRAGVLCPWLEEPYGGAGGDFLHSVVVIEEFAKAYESGFFVSLHSDVVVPYIHSFGTEAQKQRWLPGCANGEVVTAIAMTEPGAGSDLAAIRTTARKEGDEYILDGAKTFISNGLLCDLVIVAAKTSHDSTNPHGGVSLFLVEADRPGFVRGKRLKKIGMLSQDTTEMHFEGCRIPASNLLGGVEGTGFMMLMQKLAQERIVCAIGSQAGAEQVLADTITYVMEREAFGKPIGKFQNTQFKLAECATQLEVGRAFLDKLVLAHRKNGFLAKEACMAKLWHTETASRVVDECLQFFGGYGYMLEYPVARAYADGRVARIFAGSNEIMKVVIAKQMGL